MVGARFIYALTGKLSPETPQVYAPGSSWPGRQSWERQTVWQNDRFSLGFSKYAAYPITFYETQDFSLFLEGRLYGLSSAQTQTELLKLAQLVAAPGGATPSLERWLRDTDGDFLIFIFHKNTNTIFILNDSFARLPVYYHADGQTLIVSRDMGYILDNSRKTAFDPLALTQYLLFGFPLGQRALFAEIFALPPATLMSIEGRGSGLRFATIFQHNLEELPASSLSIAVNIENLVDRFRAACLNRASLTGDNVVSLSGGLDSRAVAACLHLAHISLAGASFLDHEGLMHNDVQVARQVAAHLHLPWRTFQLPPPRQTEVNNLLHLKEGANNLEMSFILPFFDELRKTFGPQLTYFTGDGGGDTLGESRPYRHLSSLDSLLRYLMERYQIFPLKVAASLTGVPATDLVDSLAGLVKSFPERTPAKKYQHFFCLEVAQKEYNEGEDRNRQFFWSVSPFYALPFFNCALSCPEDQKFRLSLYQKFLARLSPGLEKIPYANWGAPLGSWKFRALYAAKSLTRSRPQLTRGLKQMLQLNTRHSQSPFPASALRNQLLTCPTLAEVFSESALKNIARNLDTLTSKQQWTLFTLTSLIVKNSWEKTESL